MKKLSVLLLLMLCVTISGVYAVWTYSLTNDIADGFAEAKVTIADAEFVGSNGTYAVTSNLVLTVDQANDDHEAALVFSANDSNPIHLTVTFTPATNAPQSVKENAVPSELYFGYSTPTPMVYKMDAEGNYDEAGTEKNIFVLGHEADGNFVENVVWTPNADGSFTYTMDLAALQAMIKLNDNDGATPFVLDEKAEHDAFRTALTGNITARVTDGIVS